MIPYTVFLFLIFFIANFEHFLDFSLLERRRSLVASAISVEECRQYDTSVRNPSQHGLYLYAEAKEAPFLSQLYAVYSYIPVGFLLNASIVLGPMHSRPYNHKRGQPMNRVPFDQFFNLPHFQQFWNRRKVRTIILSDYEQCFGSIKPLIKKYTQEISTQLVNDFLEDSTTAGADNTNINENHEDPSNEDPRKLRSTHYLRKLPSRSIAETEVHGNTPNRKLAVVGTTKKSINAADNEPIIQGLVHQHEMHTIYRHPPFTPLRFVEFPKLCADSDLTLPLKGHSLIYFPQEFKLTGVYSHFSSPSVLPLIHESIKPAHHIQFLASTITDFLKKYGSFIVLHVRLDNEALTGRSKTNLTDVLFSMNEGEVGQIYHRNKTVHSSLGSHGGGHADGTIENNISTQYLDSLDSMKYGGNNNDHGELDDATFHANMKGLDSSSFNNPQHTLLALSTPNNAANKINNTSSPGNYITHTHDIEEKVFANGIQGILDHLQSSRCFDDLLRLGTDVLLDPPTIYLIFDVNIHHKHEKKKVQRLIHQLTKLGFLHIFTRYTFLDRIYNRNTIKPIETIFDDEFLNKLQGIKQLSYEQLVYLDILIARSSSCFVPSHLPSLMSYVLKRLISFDVSIFEKYEHITLNNYGNLAPYRVWGL
jgi:hypothetical protein